MKKLLMLCLGLVVLSSASSQKPSGKPGELSWLGEWLTGWEWVSQKKFKLDIKEIPVMYFFDEKFFYTNQDSVQGKRINGPSLFSMPQNWVTGEHFDTLRLPNNELAPVRLMSFAGPLEGNKPFFVMAAPSIWKKAAVPEMGISLSELVTCVFIHEFSHSQQLDGFGKQVEYLEKKYGGVQTRFDDDIIQSLYKKDSLYTKAYEEEVGLFYKALYAKDQDSCRSITKKALSLMNKRHEDWKKKGLGHYAEMDDIFLSMEGLGQYAAISWLADKSKKDLPFESIVNAFRRNGKIWSQDEGMVMFLILARLTKPDWNNDMFGKNPKPIRQLIETELERD